MTLAVLPLWWSLADEGVCAAYHAEDWRIAATMPNVDPETCDPDEVERFCGAMHPRMNEYTCRRCEHFERSDGLVGACLTVDAKERNKRLPSNAMCEDWEPRT